MLEFPSAEFIYRFLVVLISATLVVVLPVFVEKIPVRSEIQSHPKRLAVRRWFISALIPALVLLLFTLSEFTINKGYKDYVTINVFLVSFLAASAFVGFALWIPVDRFSKPTVRAIASLIVIVPLFITLFVPRPAAVIDTGDDPCAGFVLSSPTSADNGRIKHSTPLQASGSFEVGPPSGYSLWVLLRSTYRDGNPGNPLSLANYEEHLSDLLWFKDQITPPARPNTMWTSRDVYIGPNSSDVVLLSFVMIRNETLRPDIAYGDGADIPWRSWQLNNSLPHSWIVCDEVLVETVANNPQATPPEATPDEDAKSFDIKYS